MKKYLILTLALFCASAFAQSNSFMSVNTITHKIAYPSDFASANATELRAVIGASGTAGGDLIGSYPNPALGAIGTAGTYYKVMTDSKGRITNGWTSLSATTDIPPLNASNITTGTLSASLLPAFTGDVTTSAGSAATTIANSAVTLAKMASVATGTVIGRSTAGTGAPEVLTTIPTATLPALTGDVTTSSGSAATTLASVGTAGTYYKTTFNAKGLETSGQTTLAETDLTFTDITTLNASTSKHGLVPKLPNDATKFYDGTGNYSTPSGGGLPGDGKTIGTNSSSQYTLTNVVATLVDGATINTDVSVTNEFMVTLGGNRTLATPTGGWQGTKCRWWFVQDGTGNRTITFSADYGTTIPDITLTTNASKADMVDAELLTLPGGTAKWRIVGFKRGFTP